MYSPNKTLNVNTSVLTSYENAKRGRYVRSNEPSIYEKYPQTSFPFFAIPPLPYKSPGLPLYNMSKVENKDIRIA